MLANNIVLLVSIEKFETNHVLVNVNKFKPYKYMESKVQKQEHMLIYWEQNAGAIHVKNFDTEEDDEDCEIHKPQMRHTKDEGQMKNPIINTISILDL